MDFSEILDSKSYDQVCNYVSMQVCKYASIHIYANKCEAIYMSAVAAFFIWTRVGGPTFLNFSIFILLKCLF